MKILLPITLLLTLVSPFQSPPKVDESSPMAVVNFKWTKTRRAVAQQETSPNAPVRGVIPANKTFARNARINDPAGVRDPNADTLDTRSAAMDKNVQESRNPQAKSVDGFLYKVKLQNATARVVEIIFWEYQFVDSSDPNISARRQFLCGVNVQPEKSIGLEGFSLSGPTEVVSVGTLSNKSEKPLNEKVLINRVEFADGTIWQRRGWSFQEVKLTYERVLREPWTPGMCKPL